MLMAPAGEASQQPAHLDRRLSSNAEGPIAPSNGFQLAGANGYTIHVVGAEEDQIGLPASLVGLIARANGAQVEYLTQGVVSEDAISAQFGTLGSLNMHFVPSGAIASFQPGCAKGLARGREGIWSGTFQFAGANDFTSVSATEASPTWPGSISSCDSSSVSSGGPAAWLSAEGPSRLTFNVAQPKGPGSATQFDASSLEQLPGLTIRSEVWASGSARAFTYDKKLLRASIRPPSPFSGQAEFRRKPHRRRGSLTGTMRVSLPGLSAPLKLVGPAVFAAIHRGSYEQTH